MNASPVVRAGYRVGVLALAALSLSACAANPFAGKAANSSHHCADVVAQAITSGKSVPGTWACMAPELQNTLHSYGMDGDGAFADAALPPMTVTYIGTQGDVVVYHVVIPATANQSAESLVLIIYTDAGGKVTNAGIGHPAF